MSASGNWLEPEIVLYHCDRCNETFQVEEAVQDFMGDTDDSPGGTIFLCPWCSSEELSDATNYEDPPEDI